MAHYYIDTEGEIRTGEASLDTIRFLMNQNPVKSSAGGILRTDAPFQIIRITYDPESDPAYQITVIAPDFYSHISVSPQDAGSVSNETELHQHNTFELVYVREGELVQRIEARRHRYLAGSCVLLNRNVRHAEEYNSSFSTVSLSLSKEFFSSLLTEGDIRYLRKADFIEENTELRRFLDEELFGSGRHEKQYIDFIPAGQYDVHDDPLCALFEEMSRLLLSREAGSTYHFRGYICHMLALLSRKDLYNTVPIAIGTRSESELFSRIDLVLEKNGGRVSRKDLERELLYSGNYLNRIVHTFTGMSLTQYALSYTLRRAARLLVSDERSVTDLMHDLGFTNRNYFYREFKKVYGCSPREFRIQNKG